MAGHDGLRARLAAQSRHLRSGEWVEELGAELSKTVYASMERTTNLANKVTQLTQVTLSEGQLHIGMGPKDLVGRAEKAPSGTIAAFLRDHPRFYRRFKKSRYQFQGPTDKRGQRKIVKIYGDTSSHGPVDKRSAWWNLPPEGKAILQREREGGAYGGANALAKYFYVQDQGKADWRASGDKAAIVPQNWLEPSIVRWRQTGKRKVVAKFIARMKMP